MTAFEICDHPAFQAQVYVNRLSAQEGGPITGYTADVRIRCCKCGLPFRFKGLPAGVRQNRPTTSWGGDELRAPIEPAPDMPSWETPVPSQPVA